MAGELFLLDEIAKAGDPWHGLYRAATGKIHTPHGVDVPLRGVPPEMEGSCYKVAIPGTPAATNTAADATAGRTWLNYAIVAGYNNRLYGKPMFGPVYIDDNNRPWRVVVSPWVTWSGLTGTLHLELAFLPLFGGTVQQTIAKTLTFTALSADSPVTQSRLEDVAENGRRFMVSHVGFPASGSYARRCMALGEVALNGVPPAVTATFTKIADEAGSYVESFTSAITTQVSGWKNGAQVIVTFGPGQTIDYYNQIDSGAWQIAFGTTNGSLTRLVGGRYAGNAPQAVTSVETRTHTSTGQILNAPVGYKKWTQGVQQSLSLAVMAGGATIASYTLGATGSGTTENDGLGTITVNGSVSYTSSDGRSASNPNWGGNETTIPFVGWPPAPDGLFYAVRYSNTVYGFVGGDRIAGLQNGASKILVSNVGGRIGSDAGWHSVTDLAQAPMYASEHPVTGQIERSTTLVCWV